MKTIGLIGGMSWESTATYYLEINRYINQKLGGYYSAKCILYNVQYQDIKDVHKNGDWDRAGDILAEAALFLKAAGADFIILATNTMHIVAPRIKAAVDLPFLHIADVTADRLIQDNIKMVALLGTRFTLEKDFYKKVLEARGINVLIPAKNHIEKIHEIINKELILGKIEASSRDCFKSIILELQKRGAQGVILGCTEIGLLIKQEDSVLPVYDTALLHADAAADYALSNF
ncbi:aspartate/glutamate racemase family protein [Desulfosporosinus sp. PR]|uniref:aspartate/glutamate racemase family protein n=1 Tax=Candidatus Desulfosporosinus nitrosoreducens TaxID=3401928 RepID=UPI0027ED0BFB|nr:aspartate/glutamate racemase family protein [Desulfosporosinus sp. PR]MDQ7094571.1 aspartate/glutamate racemase family protein [Desulfosporosinus sp. PR]